MVSLVSWRGNEWRRYMSKKIARVARLIRGIAVVLIPLLEVIKLLIEIANKAANCNAHQFQLEVSEPR